MKPSFDVLPPFTSRRHFISTLSGACAAVSVAAQEPAAAVKKLRIGCVGCGNRGTFVAGVIRENPGFEITAAADYFATTADEFGKTFSVPESARFSGLGGLQKMLESGLVDAVAINTPPFFHPEQAALCVAAGKHALIAKPVAIDVPGCAAISKLAGEAAQKGIVLIADVQCRGDAIFQEAIRRVHDGKIGPLVMGECFYEAQTIPLKSQGSGPEDRLRNAIRYRDLSGDIITEQNIHALDIVSWALGAPLNATGMSGRSVRDDVGDASDHYSVQFQFQTGAVNFTSRQFSAWGLPGRNETRLVGTQGALFTSFAGRVYIRADKENYWAGGETKDLYKSGTASHVQTFHERIMQQKPEGNASVIANSQTVLMTLLGAMAADARRTVTWQELLREGKAVSPDLTGLKV